MQAYVPLSAAEALVLPGAFEYAAEVVPLVEHVHRENLYLRAHDFHVPVDEELAEARTRFDENFRKMKARPAK